MAQIGALKTRIVQDGVGEIGLHDEGFGQFGLRKIGAPRRHLAEIAARFVDLHGRRIARLVIARQRSFPEVGADQPGFGQIGALAPFVGGAEGEAVDADLEALASAEAAVGVKRKAAFVDEQVGDRGFVPDAAGDFDIAAVGDQPGRHLDARRRAVIRLAAERGALALLCRRLLGRFGRRAARDAHAPLGLVAPFVERGDDEFAVAQRGAAGEIKAAICLQRRGGAVEREFDNLGAVADPPRQFEHRALGAHRGRRLDQRRRCVDLGRRRFAWCRGRHDLGFTWR